MSCGENLQNQDKTEKEEEFISEVKIYTGLTEKFQYMCNQNFSLKERKKEGRKEKKKKEKEKEREKNRKEKKKGEREGRKEGRQTDGYKEGRQYSKR